MGIALSPISARCTTGGREACTTSRQRVSLGHCRLTIGDANWAKCNGNLQSTIGIWQFYLVFNSMLRSLRAFEGRGPGYASNSVYCLNELVVLEET